MSDDQQPDAESPAEAAPLTADEIAESKRYSRAELQCTLLDMALDLAYLSVAALALATLLDDWLAGVSWLSRPWLRLSAMYLVVMAGHYAVSFPLSCYSGFVLEHRFGMSKQSFGRWLWRYVMQTVLVTVFGLLLVQGLFWLIWLSGPWWWVAAAIGAFVVSVVLGQLVPVVIVPLFYKVERLEDAELLERTEELTRGTSLGIEGVYRLQLSRETVKANAMLAGLGRTRRVLLGDTLLDEFEPDEVDVVLAHEIGHHVFHHIPKMMVTGLVYSATGFFVCDRLLHAWVGGSGGLVYSEMPVAALPLLLLMITVFSLLLSPLQNAISRRFERQCDRYALRRTSNPDAFRSAFRKLARLNKDDPDPHPVEVWLLHDHPPIKQRLALADE